MRKKLITAILICTMGLSMFGCNNKSSSNKSSNNSQKAAEEEAKANVDLPDADKTNEDNDINNTDNVSPEYGKMTSEEIVSRYEQLRPKVTELFKEKLEKPNEGKGDQYKVYEYKEEHNIKDYKGVERIEYEDGEAKQLEHFTYAIFSLMFDDSGNKGQAVYARLMETYTIDKIKEKGTKIKGTMFQELIDLVSPDKDKINYDELDEKVAKGILEKNVIDFYYGHTKLTFQCNGVLTLTIVVK